MPAVPLSRPITDPRQQPVSRGGASTACSSFLCTSKLWLRMPSVTSLCVQTHNDKILLRP